MNDKTHPVWCDPPDIETPSNGQGRNGGRVSGVGGAKGGGGPEMLGNGVGRSPLGPSPEVELQPPLQDWVAGDWWRWLQVQPPHPPSLQSPPHPQGHLPSHPQNHPQAHSHSHLQAPPHSHPCPQLWSPGDVKPHLQALWWREAGAHPGSIPPTMASLTPTTASEWQLYRVLQRANLLQYYETFIGQGGDDVQQLCEAGEEEFLEIMALVGMAAKPLHVRRLQKALQEWVANPAAFRGKNLPQTNPAPGSISAVIRDQQAALTFPVTTAQQPPQAQQQQQQQQPQQQQQQQPPQQSTPIANAQSWTPQSLGAQSVSPTPQDAHSPSSASPQSDVKDPYLIQLAQNSTCSSPTQGTAFLDDAQINAIAEAAARLAKALPEFEAKELNTKKQVNKDIHAVMSMPEDDPNRMDELRKYAAIYGRFDSKRKNDRPMSLHEMSVNEASAQLCRHIPALLTRREELFPLARQVVRDSGYQYSKGHSRTNILFPTMQGSASGCSRVHDSNSKTVKIEMTKAALNEKMIGISQEMESLSRCQVELRAALVSVEGERKETLHEELEAMTIKMREFMAQKVAIAAQLQRMERRKRGNEHLNGEEDTDSSFITSGGSGNSSPNEDIIEEGDIGLVRVINSLGRNTQCQKIIVRETLMDVGLRIAKQYGMDGFAESLQESHQESLAGGAATLPAGNGANRDNEDDEPAPVLELQVQSNEAREGYVSGEEDDRSNPPRLDNHGAFLPNFDSLPQCQEEDQQNISVEANGSGSTTDFLASAINGNSRSWGPALGEATLAAEEMPSSNGNAVGRTVSKRKASRPAHYPAEQSDTPPAKRPKSVLGNGDNPILV